LRTLAGGEVLDIVSDFSEYQVSWRYPSQGVFARIDVDGRSVLAFSQPARQVIDHLDARDLSLPEARVIIEAIAMRPKAEWQQAALDTLQNTGSLRLVAMTSMMLTHLLGPKAKFMDIAGWEKVLTHQQP